MGTAPASAPVLCKSAVRQDYAVLFANPSHSQLLDWATELCHCSGLVELRNQRIRAQRATKPMHRVQLACVSPSGPGGPYLYDIYDLQTVSWH